MKKLIIVILPVLLVCIIAGCKSKKNTEQKQYTISKETTNNLQESSEETTNNLQESSEEMTTSKQDRVQMILNDMTIEEKVGQLFIIRPEDICDDEQRTGVNQKMKDALKQYAIGGVIMFSENIESPNQIKQFNMDLQKESKIPLFISVDEEGGRVARLAKNSLFNLKQYESALAVGETSDYEKGFEMGSTIGSYLSEYGFNVNFAPVADVNTNPDNPVIGDRAFSGNVHVVKNMANAVAAGLKSKNIIPVYKHFPGHGDTKEDSHKGLAVSYKTKQNLKECEWIPYENLTENDFVMVGHIALPNVTNSMVPATMSYKMVTECLKKEVGFKGIVVTDALEMGAITQLYENGEACITAFNAGCDILLLPSDFKGAYEAMVNAVRENKIQETRLNEAVYKIIEYKLNNLSES